MLSKTSFSKLFLAPAAFSAAIFFNSSMALATPYKLYSDAQAIAAAASVFHFTPDGFTTCSAVFIGSQGEALTNLHCVESCLETAGVLESEDIEFMTKKKVKIPEGQAVTCQAQIYSRGAKPKTLISSSYQVRKIFGPGFLSPRDRLSEFLQKFPAEYAQLLEEGYEARGDLVLIKVNIQKSPCAQLAAADFASTESISVLNLSYPILFRYTPTENPFQPALFMTLGDTLLSTEGEASSNSLYFSKGNFPPEQIAYMRAFLARGTFLTSIDISGGASGSGIFSSEGKLIGLVRSTFAAEGSDYLPWTGEGIDLGYVIPYLDNAVSKCE